MDRLKYFLIIMLVATGISSGRRPVHADTPGLSLSGPVGLIHADDLIPVDIMASSGGLTINAAQVHVTYPANRLRIEFVRREQSIFDLWPEPPQWDNAKGSMSLSGGHPGGLVSAQSRVATIYFRASQPGPVDVSIDGDGSGLYLNDGSGTKVNITSTSRTLQLSDTLVAGIPLNALTTPEPNNWSRLENVSISWATGTNLKYSYIFSADCQALPDETPEGVIGQVNYPTVDEGINCFTIKSRDIDGTWSLPSQYRFLIDRTAPRPFTILHPDLQQVHGANSLTWTAIDDISGIASTTLHVTGKTERPVTSPLTIESTWRGKLLTIVLADEAGNLQSATWQMDGRVSSWTSPYVLFGSAVILLAGPATIFFIRRRVHRARR